MWEIILHLSVGNVLTNKIIAVFLSGKEHNDLQQQVHSAYKHNTNFQHFQKTTRLDVTVLQGTLGGTYLACITLHN